MGQSFLPEFGPLGIVSTKGIEASLTTAEGRQQRPERLQIDIENG
jgi:hypothetical protein